jgi:hypothetical protein
MNTARLLIGRQLLVISVIAISWFVTFRINSWVFAATEHTSVASWVFLPAAFRPLAVLLFEEVGATGLVLGGYLTVYGTARGDNFHEIMLSVVSGITPLFAVMLGKWLFEIPRDLAGLRAGHIIVLSVSCAAANAIVLNGYMWASGHLHGDFIQIATVFVGDVTGAAIVLFLLSSTLSFALPRGAKS